MPEGPGRFSPGWSFNNHSPGEGENTRGRQAEVESYIASEDCCCQLNQAARQHSHAKGKPDRQLPTHWAKLILTK